MLTSAANMTLRLLILGAVALTVSAAALDGSPAASPSASSAQVLALTVTQVASFSAVNVVQLSGAKDADSTVTVQPIAPATTSPCPPISGAGTNWLCVAAVPNGPGVSISVIETLNADSMTVSTGPFDVLGPPTISGNAGLITTGIISGQGLSGSTVTATVANAAAGGCASPVASSGYWSCSIAVPSGDWSVTATQARADLGGGQSSSISGSLDVVVDKDAPAPPIVTSPRTGSTVTSKLVTFAGTGESGGALDVYLDNVPICSSAVADNRWSCSASAPTGGTHSVLAVQRDEAGNFSSPSSVVRITFGAVPPGAGTVPQPSISASPSPTRTTPAPTVTVPPLDLPPSVPPPTTGWTTPTGFGALLPSLSSSVTSGSLFFAPLLAIVFLVLVALPIRLLASAIRGRTWHRPRFLGRNQDDPDEPTQRTPIRPWAAILLILAVAVTLIVFSGTVNDELRYLRLGLAVTIGLAVLNLVGVFLPSRVAGRRIAVSARMRFVVLMLVAAGVTAVLSKVTDIHPRVVAGVLIGTAFAGAVDARSRAVVRLAEVGAVTAIAIVGWIGHSLIANSSAFLPLLGREILATLALAGLGSAVVMILPIASLPGRVILEWSLPAWVATAFVVATVAALVFLGAGPASFPMIGSLAVAAAFAAVSLSLWAWLRFVEPAMAQ